jgi:hypothetical protein
MGNRYTIRHGASSPVEYPDKLLKYELGFCDTDEVLYIKNGEAEVKPVAKVLKELSSVPSELYPVSEKVMLDYLAGTTYFQSIVKKIYPVGSIYMSTSSTNPQTIFGGTWVAWGQGRVPVGVGTSTDNEDISMSFNSANLYGGYANIRNLSHTHTINHTHKNNFSIASGGAHTHTINHRHSDTFSVASGGSHSHKIGADLDSAAGGYGYTIHRTSSNINASGQYNITGQSAGSHSHTLNGSVSNHSGSSGSAGSHAHTLNGSVTSYSGSSGSSGVTKENGQNYPPYVTCYMWRRTA